MSPTRLPVALLTASLLACGGTGGASLLAQNGRPAGLASGLTLGVHDPFSFEYIRPEYEGVRHVALVGEDVFVQWQMVNALEEAFETPIDNGRLVDLLRITAIESPVAVEGLSLRLLDFYTRTDTSVNYPAQPPAATLRLATGESMSARALLLGLSTPGVYKLRVGPAFKGPRIVSDVVEFELRPLTGRAERAEFRLHQLWNTQSPLPDCKGARSAVDALLSVHPNAVAAYEFLGGCAWKEGRMADALSAYSRALHLLDQRLDDLYIAAHRPGDVQRRAQGLVDAIASLRAGRPMGPLIEGH